MILPNNKNIPLRYLDGKNHIHTVEFPPMSEGIAYINDKLAILTESVAKKYQKGGKGPIDNIIYMKDSMWKKSDCSPCHCNRSKAILDRRVPPIEYTET